MDWNGNVRMPYVTRAEDNSNFNFLYNCTNDDHFQVEMKQQTMVPTLMEKNMNMNMNMNMNNFGMDPKKKRLSNEQLELLENSFHEEIKLEPERKMKLAKELGLQPRQIAIWFQNRRARWKGKQLEHLYDALKQEYDAVSRDKHKLQQEVIALRALILKDELVGKNKVSTTAGTGYTDDISGEETTVESTSMSMTIPISHNHHPAATATATATANLVHHIADCNFPMNMGGILADYNTDNPNNNNSIMLPPYWSTSAP